MTVGCGAPQKVQAPPPPPTQPSPQPPPTSTTATAADQNVAINGDGVQINGTLNGAEPSATISGEAFFPSCSEATGHWSGAFSVAYQYQ